MDLESSVEVSNDRSNFPERPDEALGLLDGSPASPLHRWGDTDEGQHLPRLLYENQSDFNGSKEWGRRMAPNSAVLASLPLDNLTSEIQKLLGPSFLVPQSTDEFLPNYIRGPTMLLQKEDVGHLAAKDALAVPDIALRDELLKAYVHNVHT
ncbi:hypothetical protein VE00_10077 [Pseudogymnoascus sp. WSF 3629]|nr:hypothetical protein VE00_10077 [Pseudogymnoascus sp. WSF 3629]